MRTLLIGALAATLVGCNCLLPPQSGMGSCAAANGFACFDSTAASQPIEPKPVSFQTDSAATEIKSAIAAKPEKPSPAHAREGTHLVIKMAKPAMIAAQGEPSARVPLPPRSLKTRLPPASSAAADSDKPRANIAASQPTGGAVAAPEANNKDRPDHSETVPRGDAEKTAATSPAGSAQSRPSDTAWVVSETTSPVDYSPLITAVIESTSSVKDAPNTLAVRCSGSRTELLLRTEGAWHASRANEILVDYQISDQPSVRLYWTVSADGKTASYKDDAVGLLRSLPEGARLKISMFDRQGLGLAATFQLTGWESVRKKIGLACKWPSRRQKKCHRGNDEHNSVPVVIGSRRADHEGRVQRA